MLNSEIDSLRRRKSALLKSWREMYGINFMEIQQESRLSTETCYRLESGDKSWTIDSEIQYLYALNILIDKRIRDKPLVKYPQRPAILVTLQTIHT